MDKIDICNAALIEAHQDATITNIDESSPEAERCRRIYDSTRRELLSMYPWSFANKFVKLARVSSNVDGYKYAYLYPSEALRINGIFVSEEAYKARKYISFDFAEAVISDVDGKKCILCDYETPFVFENIDITKESFFPETFCRLMYLYMALKITKMAGVGDDVRKEIRAEIQEQVSIAATISNREELRPVDENNYYVDVRG
jgi:hypothetical protein